VTVNKTSQGSANGETFDIRIMAGNIKATPGNRPLLQNPTEWLFNNQISMLTIYTYLGRTETSKSLHR
jgi:hypothetical protein